MKKSHRKISQYLLLFIAFSSFYAPAIAQNLEVIGKVKVTDMESITSGEKVVVRDVDNNLAERDFDQLVISYFVSLPNGVSLLVDAGESISNLVDAGASVVDLLGAGVSISDLLGAGITLAELVAGGAPVASMLDAGLAPIDIFNEGIPVDSFYGKMYEGGLIFHLNTSTGVGYVAATSNQAGAVEWGNNVLTGASGLSIGTGESNTALIVEALGMGGYAARLCFDLVLNEKSDWFLPSRDELIEMHTNLYLKGFGSFGGTFYWSSSEDNVSEAWRVDITDGDPEIRPKSESNKAVRAIRSF